MRISHTFETMVSERTIEQGAMILIQAQTESSSSRLTNAFKSLDDQSIEDLAENGAIALTYGGNNARSNHRKIYEDFAQLCRECNEESSLIYGRIALYRNGKMVHEWHIDQMRNVVPYLLNVGKGFENRMVFGA